MHMTPGYLRGLLEEAVDDGNATGLDGWIGPGRGDSRGTDDEAIRNRDRCLDGILNRFITD